MTLDATKPTDQSLVSELAGYIREARAAMNVLTALVSDFSATELSLSVGTTSLVIGTDLADVGFEIIFIDSVGASAISTITGGTAGQVKLFIFQDNVIDFVDGTKSAGHLYLNHLPALTNFAAAQDDIIMLVNIGGDGSTDNGYWKEVLRTISLK
jgi:hypothetical protein